MTIRATTILVVCFSYVFSVSHYSWGGALQWLDRGWNDTLEVETVEDRKITFNIKTAEIMQ